MGVDQNSNQNHACFALLELLLPTLRNSIHRIEAQQQTLDPNKPGNECNQKQQESPSHSCLRIAVEGGDRGLKLGNRGGSRLSIRHDGARRDRHGVAARVVVESGAAAVGAQDPAPRG